MATPRGQYGSLARAFCARDQHADGPDLRPKRPSAGVFGGIADRDTAYGGVHDSLDVGRFESEISRRTEEHE